MGFEEIQKIKDWHIGEDGHPDYWGHQGCTEKDTYDINENGNCVAHNSREVTTHGERSGQEIFVESMAIK